MLLNALVNQPVLSFVADDDQLDFACVADECRLSKLHCRAEDLELLFDNGVAQIQPLQPEMDGEEEILTNLTELRISLPDIAVADRRVPWDPQLHFVAIRELLTFAGIKEPILGLGSFDPPEDESELELIGA